MGHPQPRTPLQTNNTTTEGVTNKNVQPERTNAMDMQFHWLRDWEMQKQLCFYWRSGPTNDVDYFSKTQHPPAHNRKERIKILTPLRKLLKLRQQQASQVKQWFICKGVLNILFHVEAATEY